MKPLEIYTEIEINLQLPLLYAGILTRKTFTDIIIIDSCETAELGLWYKERS